MRRWWMWLMCGVVLGGCGGAARESAGSERGVSAAERARVVAEYRRAHQTADEAMAKARGRQEPEVDARARAAAARCLDAWRAAPEELASGPLLRMWEVAVTRGRFRLLRPAVVAWERRVRRIRGIDEVPEIAVRLRILHAGAARLARVYARPVDACATVRAWRQRGWQPPAPPAVRRAASLDEPLDVGPRPAGSHGWVISVGRPDHDGYCDPVFSVLAPDDTFCG